MILSIDQALEKVASHAGRQPMERTRLDRAVDLVLAETIHADLDSPPFTKSLMDGFAVRAADLPTGRATLRRVGETLAGQGSPIPLAAGEALQIMTGAPVPPGADAVVMIERTKLEADQVMIDDGEFAVGQNIMPQGLEYRRGEEVLHPGCRLGPAELGLLASVGQIEPLVFRRPRLAILSTGDEVCPANQTPGPNQIRNSNEWTLYAACLRAGAEVRLLGIARDDETDLKSKIAQGLAADVLLLSGGVSAGKRDLVPRMLQALGVDEIFHGVAFKPGKPLWFGRREGTLVFGLPGNPVSVLCCFEVFVQTALRVRQGSPNPFPPMIDARLAEDVNYPTRRTTYHPAWLDREGETVTVRPVTWKGSPDLRALINANALVVFPEGPGQYAKGDCLKVLPL